MQEANMRIKGAQIHQFNNVQQRKLPRSTFQKDFPIKTTMDVDYLIPLFVEECYPGDHKKINVAQLLARLTTPIKPIMDNLYIETWAFFTPRRILWDNFEKQQGEATDATYVGLTAITTPVLDVTKAPLSTTGFLAESLADYFGITTYTSGLTKLDALYWRNYNRVYNDWFRDENIIPSIASPTDDGPDDPSIYVLQKRRKIKDYLTGMLPWPQKGVAPTIPVGSSAPVLFQAGVNPTLNRNYATGNIEGSAGWTANVSGQIINTSTTNGIGWDPNGNLYADLTSATGAVLNLLRQNSIYTQMLELDARSGTRYIESTYARFGAEPQDFRLQRPELIGYGRSMVNVYAVPQTAASPSTPTSTNAQGNLAAFGVAKSSGEHKYSYACQEHGILMVIMNIRADLSYQQNVPRNFTRQTRLDFYEPLMNGMGEQPVYNRELLAQGTSADDNVAGYQERFSDLRYRQPQVTGKFRSQTPTPLDYWHVAEEFGSLPTLNQTFIEPQTPMSRVVAVTTEPHFYLTAYVQFQDTKVLPIRSNPGIDVL